jgi:hypothetical protein
MTVTAMRRPFSILAATTLTAELARVVPDFRSQFVP